MTNNARTSSSLALLSLLSVAALLGLALLLFAIYSMNEESTRASAEISLAIERQSHALSMNNFLRATEESRKALSGHFVTEDSIVSFIERIEALAAEADISFSLSAVDPSAEGSVLDVSFKTGGTFENLHHFLSLLEALPLELDVTRFVIGKVPAALGKTGDLWEGEGSIRLQSFIKI